MSEQVMASRINHAVGYIDQTVYVNQETKTRWRNDEVMELLAEIRDMLMSDRLIDE